ncbi:MAG: TonB C-terminal domain-containing protein [Campylobacterales bacterium]|nr:TonB C-terminal domain-containing protein [Campylobacterales bacterium]
MDRDNYYFFLSGIISLSIFSFLAFIVLYGYINIPQNKVFALNKDKFISISIEMPKEEVVIPTPKPEIQTPEIEESKEVDVGELFSDVWTKKIEKKEKPKEEKVLNKRLQDALTKTKTVEKKEYKPSVVEKTQTTSSGDEVNEYLAKIQALVYKNFYPPQNSEGHSVKAVIELDTVGIVKDFRILRYSENEALNQECDKIKQRLLNQLFPTNPDNKQGSFIIILTSKE